VGIIPTEWDTQTGEQMTTLIGKGGSPRWQGFEYSNDGMLFVTSENVRNGFLDLREPKYLPLAFHEKLKRTKLQKDDILINLVGASIGRSCQIQEDLGEANVNQAVAVYRVRKEYCSEFVACCFQALSTIKRILEMQVDAALPNISLGDLRRFLIPFPPAAEQRAIAEALSDVDGLLGALEALIAKKRAIKQAAMQQLLTGKTRLPGFSGEWEKKRLGDFVTFLRHGVNSRAELSNSGSVKYLHYGDIHTSHDVRLDPWVTPMPFLPADRATTLDRLQDGDLVLVDASEDLDGVGKSVEITGVANAEVVSGLHTIAARFDKTALADGFKAYLQFCPAFRDHLKRLAAGTKVYATNRAHLASVELPLPTTEEQREIATVLSDMDAELAALERRRDKTRAIKQGMMQQLLTGRVRLV
jgi:type I restriction enzyme S subunit